ncbi:hypothetical protein DPMN_171901 [Dreissena polymorpha]|uniref:Uncharacterized protein n=1 Tax=Dreissena polymorpha TaxID=45954 RepID=A0A9D4E2I9_DREPO|nr:hypothetical protein DPMN_171901 [Dreissena polymorpha]
MEQKSWTGESSKHHCYNATMLKNNWKTKFKVTLSKTFQTFKDLLEEKNSRTTSTGSKDVP